MENKKTGTCEEKLDKLADCFEDTGQCMEGIGHMLHVSIQAVFKTKWSANHQIKYDIVSDEFKYES